MSTEQPNILLIQSDQHRADCIGANGHPFIKTPNLDRLASEGVTFANAYCPIPLCSPARACLLTGQWSHQHGSLANCDAPHWRPIADDVPTYSQALREAGYFLSHLAKWHVDPVRTPTEFGYHESIAGPEFEKPYVAWRTEQGLPKRPIDDKYFEDVDAHFGYVDPEITPEQSRLGYGATMAIERLERCAAQEKPFFFAWNPPEPHFPCVVPEPYASMYPPESIPPWPGFADPLEAKPYMHGQMRRTWRTDTWDWDEWAPHVGRYMGEISLLDAQIGRVLSALDRLGLNENTIVVYTADHGDMTGNHGLIDKHCVMYDDIVRVPLIIRWPETISSGSVHQSFVTSALDLAATFCDAGRTKTPRTFSGESLLPALRGETPGREDIFSEYHGNQFGLYTQRMVRNRRYKYVYNATDLDELYDLEADPAEVHNLAARPEMAEVLKRMQKRLIEWMEASNDRQLNTWIRTQLEHGRTR